MTANKRGVVRSKSRTSRASQARGPRTNPVVRAYIEGLALHDPDWTSSAVEARLRRELPDYATEIPGQRAIQKIMAAARARGQHPDGSPHWSIGDCADPADAALVLPVIRRGLGAGEGGISRDMGDAIIRIRRALPELPVAQVYLAAARYIGAKTWADQGDHRFMDSLTDELARLAPVED